MYLGIDVGDGEIGQKEPYGGRPGLVEVQTGKPRRTPSLGVGAPATVTVAAVTGTVTVTVTATVTVTVTVTVTATATAR